MGMEIERKFLVRGDAWKAGVEGIDVRQGYLTSQEDGLTVRVRVAGERAWLTVKGPSEGIARAEFEYEIPAREAGEMIRMCPDNLVEKTRYRVEHGGRTWEIDEFHGRNAGLVMAEVELPDESADLVVPDWVEREVSGDPRYYNAALARNPCASW